MTCITALHYNYEKYGALKEEMIRDKIVVGNACPAANEAIISGV